MIAIQTTNIYRKLFQKLKMKKFWQKYCSFTRIVSFRNADVHIAFCNYFKFITTFLKRISYRSWLQILIICKCKWKIFTKDTFEVKTTQILISFSLLKKLFYRLKAKYMLRRNFDIFMKDLLRTLLLFNNNENFIACLVLIANYRPQERI